MRGCKFAITLYAFVIQESLCLLALRLVSGQNQWSNQWSNAAGGLAAPPCAPSRHCLAWQSRAPTTSRHCLGWRAGTGTGGLARAGGGAVLIDDCRRRRCGYEHFLQDDSSLEGAREDLVEACWKGREARSRGAPVEDEQVLLTGERVCRHGVRRAQDVAAMAPGARQPMRVAARSGVPVRGQLREPVHRYVVDR